MSIDEIQPLDAALDAALARVLIPPAPPDGFQIRLQAALARQATGQEERAVSRALAQREQRQHMAELDADYLRLRRRTLGTLIGGAFAAGAAVAVAFPWLQASFGPNATYVLAGLGAVVGLGIGTASWIGRLRLPNLLERL
jgi:ferric-dicitrate binding protein FerR (iron transport regulator)